jgi:DNA polymerase-4
MTDQSRAIVHLDLDAFYAAVEILENPDLENEPLIIGGRYRGVVATASYKAREFGVHSAMPMAHALKLCPQAILLPPRISAYQEYSRQVMAILREYTALVEQMSIDEAYLDLTGEIEQWDDAVVIAQQIQSRVESEIKPKSHPGQNTNDQPGLTASLGVATNKLVAKVASDRDKPQGLTVVRPGEEAAFLAPLPVRVLWGVGPVTADKLTKMGVTTVGELARLPEETLRERFGRNGVGMARQAQGIDERPVITERAAKSVSQETTFSRDLTDVEALHHQLDRLSEGVARRLRRTEMVAGTVVLKLRYADFTTLTRQTTLAVPTDQQRVIYQTALTLLERTWQQGRPVRLLGVAGRHLSPPVGQFPLEWD